MVHTFRLLKAHWGISITIDAEVIKAPSSVNDDSVLLDLENVKVNKEVREYLRLGLEWFLKNVDVGSCVNESTLIKIRSINFHCADYQKEGFFFAMASWAAKYYGVEMVAYEAFFDRGQNKYIFPLLEKGK